MESADTVINLAGRSVNCRYNAANRREIMESRLVTTRLVGEAIAHASQPPVLWMNASTATIYTHVTDRAMDEVDGVIGGDEPGIPSAWRFSSDVARRDTLLNLVRIGLGGSSGSGRQFVSWIHDADFAEAVDFLIAHPDLDGAVNIASPNPLPNREFMAAMRHAFRAPIGLPATDWMLEIGTFFLRTESELVLKSRRVVPGRLLESGFSFQFPDWNAAAADLVKRWRSQRRAAADA